MPKFVCLGHQQAYRHQQACRQEEQEVEYLEELQDGLATLGAQAVLQQLVLQAHGLPQVCVRLTQDVVQLKSNLHWSRMTLQCPTDITDMLLGR